MEAAAVEGLALSFRVDLCADLVVTIVAVGGLDDVLTPAKIRDEAGWAVDGREVGILGLAVRSSERVLLPAAFKTRKE